VPADPHFGVTVLKRLTLLADTRDPLQVLARQFRQRHAQRKADQVTPAYVPPVFIVGELENEIRPGHVGHARRQAEEEFAPQRELAAAIAPTRICT